MRNTLKIGLAVTLLASGLGGCTYEGSGTDNPIGRKAVWLSFLAGEDIKQACQPGAADHSRVVYNGRWEEQVRIYEWGGKEPRPLEQRVIGPADLSHFGINLDAIAAPWAGTTAKTELSAAQLAAINGALGKSLHASPPPVGEHFPSDAFYWVAASCQGGVFAFNAWEFGTPRYAEVGFDQPLLAADHTGVAFNPPHLFDSLDLSNKPRADRQRWYVEIRADGLTGSTSFNQPP